jgi:hypothetical protein
MSLLGAVSAQQPPSPTLTFAFEVRATVGPPMEVGQVAQGRRRIVPITGGTFEGPNVRGKVMNGGADWQIIRADGVADLRARYTIEAAGGACILVSSDGLRHGPPEVIAQLARGEPVDPALYYFRTVMRFETGDADLAWLNRIIAIGRGIREPLAVRLDVHEVL